MRIQSRWVMSPRHYAALTAAGLDPIAWVRTHIRQMLQAEIAGLDPSRIQWSMYGGLCDSTVHVGTVEDA